MGLELGSWSIQSSKWLVVKTFPLGAFLRAVCVCVCTSVHTCSCVSSFLHTHPQTLSLFCSDPQGPSGQAQPFHYSNPASSQTPLTPVPSRCSFSAWTSDTWQQSDQARLLPSLWAFAQAVPSAGTALPLLFPLFTLQVSAQTLPPPGSPPCLPLQGQEPPLPVCGPISPH